MRNTLFSNYEVRYEENHEKINQNIFEITRQK